MGGRIISEKEKVSVYVIAEADSDMQDKPYITKLILTDLNPNHDGFYPLNVTKI